MVTAKRGSGLSKTELANLLTNLVEKSRDIFWVMSPDYSHQLYVSPVFEEVWGRKIEELYQHPERWSSWLYPEDWIALQESIAKRNPHAKPDDVFYHHYRIIRPDGNVRWIRDQSFPIFNKNNELVCFIGIAQDVTQDKAREEELSRQKEKAEIANQTKTQLIRNLSHDIRTPLAGIIGMTGIIIDKEKDLEIKSELEHVKEAGQLLLDLLNQIMNVSQIELGEISDQQKLFSLDKIILDVKNLFLPVSRDKHLQLEVEIADNVPKEIFGNELVVHQILMNLVGNAMKFTQQGKITISARVVEKTSEKYIIEFRISDTGIGIPKDKLEFIFAPFNRLSPSFENKYKGSGLGLYMVEQYVRHLKGEIVVESTEGKGSTFSCVLPFVNQLPERKTSVENNNKKISQNDNNKQKMRILLLEDNLLAQKIASGLFTNKGHFVTLAALGKDAIRESEKQKFDILVFDLGLPDIPGLEVVKTIRQNQENPNCRTPIFALTAHADDQIRKECDAAGLQDILDKPLTNEKIEKIIADASLESA